MTTLHGITLVVLIGIGATAIMDAWLALLARLGVRTLDFALLGRWVGHLPRGRFAHVSIAKAPPIRSERALGWIAHYAIGVAFAGLLVGIQGIAWASRPSLLPAIIVGAGTVVAPLFIMQPAMGAGFAAARTPAPLKNCLRSVANHTVFGLGLYLAAFALQAIAH